MPKQLIAPGFASASARLPKRLLKYPHYLQAVKGLVAQHKQLDEPLHLAIYYVPKRHPGDVFLFEVIDRFGDRRVDPDNKIFEFAYGLTAGFPLPSGRNLRLLLANPTEFSEAAHADWKALVELKESKRRGAATVIFADQLGRKLVGLL